ncbi:MAG: flagellar hook-length control protein FliK [Pseudomonadota bacterium]
MNAGLLGEHLASPRTATKTNQSTALDTPADPSDQSGFASYVARDPEPSSDVETPSARPVERPTPDALDVSMEVVTPNLINDADANIDTTKPILSVGEIADADATPALAGPPQPSEAEIARINIMAGDTAPVATEVETAKTDLAASDPRPSVRSDPQPDSAVVVKTDRIKPAEHATGINPETMSDITDQAAPETARDFDTRLRAEGGRTELDLARASASSGSSEQAATATLESRPSLSADTSQLDRAGLGSIPRDVAVVTTEPVINIAPSTTPSAPTIAPAGLTPTAPSIPLAMPNEITGIILNALNNGVDPQEQLVVQLDPPELGRVMIDFKFDAQGLQQITVTSENPEALKRLRELHFELTQALREHGLSEQNMSFRQQADDQSQDAWTSSGPNDRDMQFTAAEQRRASLSATPIAPNVQPRDRLDLLL